MQNLDIFRSPISSRVMFERFGPQEYMALFQSHTEMKRVAKLIAATVAENGFDGVVLEIWSQGINSIENLFLLQFWIEKQIEILFLSRDNRMPNIFIK